MQETFGGCGKILGATQIYYLNITNNLLNALRILVSMTDRSTSNLRDITSETKSHEKCQQENNCMLILEFEKCR